MAAFAWMKDSDSKQKYVAHLVFFGLTALFFRLTCHFLKDGSTLDVRFKLKNPRTNNFLWKATVIAVGHKEFCLNWQKNAWVQIVETNGDKSYLPLVPVVDPDLTLYDNVNQVLLTGESSSQGVKRRMSEVQPIGTVSEPLDNNVEDDLVDGEDRPILDPHDVSKCLSDIQSYNVNKNSANKLVIHEPEGSQPTSSQHDCSGFGRDSLENSINGGLPAIRLSFVFNFSYPFQSFLQKRRPNMY